MAICKACPDNILQRSDITKESVDLLSEKLSGCHELKNSWLNESYFAMEDAALLNKLM